MSAVAAIILAALLSFAVAGSSPSTRCQAGASSMTYINGIASTPVISGCVPR